MDQNNDTDQNIGKDLEHETEVESKGAQVLDHKAAPLLKQKETKQSTSSAAAQVIDFFQENMGVVRPYIVADLIKWVNDVGEPLVLAAMKRALERGKENWGYIKGILQDWLHKGINTVEEADGEVFVFKNMQKKKVSRAIKSRTEEVIPDWFYKRNEEQVEPKVKKETAAEAIEREEIAKMLAAYASG